MHLSPAFAKGWRLLPDEIRLKILSSVLAYDNPLRPHLYMSDTLQTSDLIALSRCRETAVLAKEVFYTTNTLMLRNEPYFLNLVLPRISSGAQFIRRLHVQLNLVAENWAFLQRVASSANALTNLRHLSISFQKAVLLHTSIALVEFYAAAQHKTLQFQVQCLEVSLEISYLLPPSLRGELDTAVFGGLSIAEGEGKRVVEDWHGTDEFRRRAPIHMILAKIRSAGSATTVFKRTLKLT